MATPTGAWLVLMLLLSLLGACASPGAGGPAGSRSGPPEPRPSEGPARPTSADPTASREAAARIRAAQSQTSADLLLVKIAHAGPMSGPIGHLGQDNDLGVMLAIEELNARGMRIGGRLARFELVSGDDGADPRRAVALAQQLVAAGVHGVVGHLNSGASIPASAVYDAAGLVHVSPAATHPNYARQGFVTAFRTIGDDATMATLLGRYVARELRPRTIVVVDDRTAYGSGLASQFRQEIARQGAAVIALESLSDRTPDFPPLVEKLRRLQPDLVFFGGMDAVAGPLLGQMVRAGINARLVGGDGICTADLARLAGAAAVENRAVCLEAGGVEPARLVAFQGFYRRFKERWGREVQIYAPYAYDATMAIASAMQSAGSPEPMIYRPYLASIRFEGVTGLIQFDPRGNLVSPAYTIYSYRSGRRQAIQVLRQDTAAWP